MKKQLLLGVALFSAMSAFPQTGNSKPQRTGFVTQKISQKFAIEPAQSGTPAKPSNAPATEVNNPAPQEELSTATPPSVISWKLISGSSNVYGQLVSNSRPLQYNPNVNAVSYVHRKSFNYTATPVGPATSTSGNIVVDVSSNWGVTWDSTAIWNDATNWGRYPQGAIYSAPGNTNIANAYIVGSGPTVAGSNFTGDWYASKKLAAAGSTLYSNSPDATANATQFFSFTGAPASYSVVGQHGWSRYGFNATDDGMVRSLALIQGDNTTLGNAAKMRGVAVVKGNFNAGVFTWSSDSIIPSTYTLSAATGSAGVKVLSSDAQMAFNQAGTIGYIVMIGARSTATLQNKGYQPIIYKTTNSGASWAIVPSIDFSSGSATVVPYHLASISGNTNVSVPYVNNFDIAVDGNGKLHIGALMISTSSGSSDSLNYISQFTMSINASPVMKYDWGHVPGNRPYLYDMIGDGTGPWMVKTIDSLSTEDPGADPSLTGFGANPWDNTGTGGTKVNIDSRLQLARTPDGNYITYSYTESDTNFVVNSQKWNVLPNIKARCMAIGIGAGTNTYIVSSTKINVSRPAAGQGTVNPKVSDKAFLHYMSSITGAANTFTGATTSTVDINTPFTVTNSAPLAQLTNNCNWYTGAKLSFAFGSNIVAVKENAINSVSNSFIYPNPTKNSATLAIDLKDASGVTINVYDLVGKMVTTTKAEGQLGQNNINIDLNSLTSGIYMVNVKVGNSTSTKKLIIQ
jgi:hypothetical protein